MYIHTKNGFKVGSNGHLKYQNVFSLKLDDNIKYFRQNF